MNTLFSWLRSTSPLMLVIVLFFVYSLVELVLSKF